MRVRVYTFTLTGGKATMTSTPATKQLAAAPKAELVTVVLAPCSNEEYAQRTAKRDEVRDYIVPGYLAA
jgi:hypothetical protein